MDAHKATIVEIFNRGRILEIPYYQRAYVWGEEQWCRFISDMEMVSAAPNKPYFIGSIILKQKKTSSSDVCGDVRVVIDGQQRITTLIVYFKVLSLLKEKPRIFETFMISHDDDDDEDESQILAMRHNRIDRPAFEKVASLNELIPLEGENQIIKLYNYLRANIKADKIDSKNIKSNLLFVGVDVQANEDEQQIFDTINSLGVKLTTTELLKNYFFDEQNEADYKKYWEPIFEADEEVKHYWDQVVVAGTTRWFLSDLFFASYLNILTRCGLYDIPTSDKLRFSKVDKLFSSYKEFTSKYYKGDKVKLLLEIGQYAKIFKSSFNPDCLTDKIPSDFGLDRLNLMIFGADGTTIIPYALYVLANVNDEVERNRIFGVVESLMMRRSVAKWDTRGYYQFFSDTLINNAVLTADGLIALLAKDGGVTMPTDDDVLHGVENGKRTNHQNTIILYMLESRLRHDGDFATDLRGLADYSLEHLMPKKWRMTWENNLSEQEAEERDKLLLTLGNLAIIPGHLNTIISNGAWKTKLQGVKNRPGLRVHASGLKTLQEYLDKPVWNEGEIKNRASDLYDKMLTAWPG